MPSLAEVQAGLAAAVYDQDPGAAQWVRAQAPGAVARLGLYGNNTVLTLIEALGITYPVLRRLVGEDFFAALARHHLTQDPPRTPVLLAWGGTLPETLAGLPAATQLPWLVDVARLEWAWHQSYHAAEADPLAPNGLTALPAEQLPALGFRLHPATQTILLDHGVRGLWQAHGDHPDQEPPADSLRLEEGPQGVVITRPGGQVQVWDLGPGAVALLMALARGEAMAQATEAALAVEPAFDLMITFGTLLSAGAFTAILPDTEPHAPVAAEGAPP